MRKLFEPMTAAERERLRVQWQREVAALPPGEPGVVSGSMVTLQEQGAESALSKSARDALGAVPGEDPAWAEKIMLSQPATTT